MDKRGRILVTGARGFVGANLLHYLTEQGYHAYSAAGDFRFADEAEIAVNGSDYVFHCAGFVRGLGGNMAHQEKAYRDNTLINTNVVAACLKHKVKKLVALGTVAMYPFVAAPLQEPMIFDGVPHLGEWGYAMAKRGMLAHLMVSDLDWVMPLCTNMYGPCDRFDAVHGHVIPSLVRNFAEPGPVAVWGDGRQERDFLYVGDAVRALVLMMEKGRGSINLATGGLSTIGDVAQRLSDLSGKPFTYDPTKPSGHLTRRQDISHLTALGWMPERPLACGLRRTWDWYQANPQAVKT